jgi:hypothetical protein
MSRSESDSERYPLIAFTGETQFARDILNNKHRTYSLVAENPYKNLPQNNSSLNTKSPFLSKKIFGTHIFQGRLTGEKWPKTHCFISRGRPFC